MTIYSQRLHKKQLTEQSAAYLVTGVIISISHHFHNYSLVIYFGHLLIAVSFLVLISTMLNHNWTRRVSGPLDIFNGTTLVITFALDIIIFSVDEVEVYTQSNLLPQNLVNSLFVTILIAVFLWVFLLCLPLMVPALNPRLSVKNRLPSFMFVGALAAFLADYFLKIFPSEYVLLGVFVLVMGIIIILQKDSLPKLRLALIYFSHLFFVLALAFILAGILSVFTNAVPATWYWVSTLVSMGGFGISTWMLYRGQGRLFQKVHMFFKMRTSRIGKNVIISEVEFNDFQRYLGEKGFTLCYYSSEISGSEEEIEWYQFDSPKVIKFKRGIFNSKGIPYDVAEWQQEEWRSALSWLIGEFFKNRK